MLRTAEGDRVFIQMLEESQDSFLSPGLFWRAPYSHVARVGSDMEPCAVRSLSWKSNDVSIIGPGVDKALFMPHPRALVLFDSASPRGAERPSAHRPGSGRSRSSVVAVKPHEEPHWTVGVDLTQHLWHVHIRARRFEQRLSTVEPVDAIAEPSGDNVVHAPHTGPRRAVLRRQLGIEPSSNSAVRSTRPARRAPRADRSARDRARSGVMRGQRRRSWSRYRAGVMVTFSIWLDAGYR